MSELALWLQDQAVTLRLRASNAPLFEMIDGNWQRRGFSDQDIALASHIGETLAEYTHARVAFEISPGAYCRGALDVVEREMESLARYISVVTGITVPA